MASKCQVILLLDNPIRSNHKRTEKDSEVETELVETLEKKHLQLGWRGRSNWEATPSGRIAGVLG